MEKLFKDYEEWCLKENKDPLKEETFKEFKSLKQKEKEQAEKEASLKSKEKKELIQKQKDLFKMMCDYVGVKSSYDESLMFETLDAICKAVVMATVVCNEQSKLEKIANKVLG